MSDSDAIRRRMNWVMRAPSHDEIHARHLAIAQLVDKIRREAGYMESIHAGEQILSLLAPLDEHLTEAIGQHVRSRKEQP